ncbi:MAG: adenosylcobinamide-GDP ribazoletransferase [Rhodospirillaceae bacterium TMED8]|nr:adenosylcobinamide-GDP ribazoletransferase [Magnetovibrio sp.]OUT50555.1 MAG: adenosylcobinamide-GDP ribazoletransferase [Rhodospirillaceae bacterium TMED8]
MVHHISRGWIRDISLAGQFLTRLPFPSNLQHMPSDLANASRAFPLLGALIGGLSGGVICLAMLSGLHPLTCAFVGLIGAIALTGGLHEDGLADCADSLGGNDRSRRLEIMRDSRVGAYGVLALIFAIGLKAGIISGLTSPGMAWSAFLTAAILSRAVMAPCMFILRPARSDGLGYNAGRPRGSVVIQGLILSLAFAVIILGWSYALAAMTAALIGALVVGWLAWRRLGGYTGDVLGAAQQVAEIAVLQLVGVFLT